MTPDHTNSRGLRPPPDGVLAGETVPLENDRVDLEESRIEAVTNTLKARGPPYTEMADAELEERAVELIRRSEGD